MGMTERRAVRRSAGSARGARRPGQKKSKAVLGPRERRRAIQLAVCLALFLAVFVGRGVFPERIAAIRTQVLGVLRGDTDFQAVFSDLGQSISRGEPVLETLDGLWVQVLGGASGAGGPGSAGSPLYAAQLAWLSGFPGGEEKRFLSRMPEPPERPAPEPVPTPVPTPAPEPEVEHVDYHGPELPENTSMDKYRLGLEETVSPVMGVLTSGFGWREHPVDGEEKFHNGVDLAVNTGTAVRAFAAGTVDYIGDSPVYGLYLQLSHANGVKSFYAHCSQLLVHQGQTVAAGETVALSGDTGNTTGPHLHLELRFNGVRINPVYYIKTI